MTKADFLQLLERALAGRFFALQLRDETTVPIWSITASC